MPLCIHPVRCSCISSIICYKYIGKPSIFFLRCRSPCLSFHSQKRIAVSPNPELFYFEIILIEVSFTASGKYDVTYNCGRKKLRYRIQKNIHEKQDNSNYCTTVHALEQFLMIDSPAHIRLNYFREIIRYGTSIELNPVTRLNGNYPKCKPR